MDDHNRHIWPEGLKKTRQRLEIFEALREAKGPVSVRELCSILESRGTPMWLSTVYRVLDTLLERGAARKTAVLANGMSIYELGGAHRHYAVCIGCRRVVEMRGACPLDSFEPELLAEGFHVSGHELQISGYCGDCYTRLNS